MFAGSWYISALNIILVSYTLNSKTMLNYFMLDNPILGTKKQRETHGSLIFLEIKWGYWPEVGWKVYKNNVRLRW